MITLDQVKIELIKIHPTFFCPITKRIMDYRKVKIIQYDHGNKRKIDIISDEGYEKLCCEEVRKKINLVVLDTIDKYLDA